MLHISAVDVDCGLGAAVGQGALYYGRVNVEGDYVSIRGQVRSNADAWAPWVVKVRTAIIGEKDSCWVWDSINLNIYNDMTCELTIGSNVNCRVTKSVCCLVI